MPSALCLRLPLLLLAGLAPSGIQAQQMDHSAHAHQGHAGHAAPAEPPSLPGGTIHGALKAGLPPAEIGQGAFAAIAEIVDMLREDPATDWSAVNIGALQAHLQDMAMLTLHAAPAAERIPGGLSLRIPLSGPAAGAVRRMLPAHAPMVAAETGWTSAVTLSESEAQWRITAPDAAGEAQIRALGFFGLMAVGGHHRAHHLAIATGRDPHL